MFGQFFDISAKAAALDEKIYKICAPYFEKTDEIVRHNQAKTLAAFTACGVSSSHFAGTTGYGYGDRGREVLEQVFAHICGAEAALFRHQFMSGTHTLSVALFALLRPGDELLIVTGTPYDTIHGVIGINGAGAGLGSLADFGVKHSIIELKDGGIDIEAATAAAKNAKVCYIQRSRGYAARKALPPQEIERACAAVKAANPNIIVMVDNCYGEFTRKTEPTQHGADLIAGSLIKNPGGGIAETGGYIAGKAKYVELCAHRLTAPGTGGEIGASGNMLRNMYLGLYFAPHVTGEALKTSIFASCFFTELGLKTSPPYTSERDDIVTAIDTGSAAVLQALCEGVQAASPVDSFLKPEPWDMPGYTDKIIMAAGAFTMGSSIELSCDGPLKPPYTAYMQGGLNLTASRIALMLAAQKGGLL